MADTQVLPIPAAFSPEFIIVMGAQMQALLAICNKSPEFMRLISMLPAGSIIPNDGPGTGTQGNFSQIKVAASWLTGGTVFNSYNDAVKALDDLVVAIAHEMGHDIDPKGALNEIAEPTLAMAHQVGLDNEGVALMYEYIVSQQITDPDGTAIPMHSGGRSLQSTLSGNAEFAGFNPKTFSAGVVPNEGFRTMAIDAGGQWTGPQSPSGTPTSETYNAYEEEGWLFYNLASTKGTGDTLNTIQTAMSYIPVNSQSQQYVLNNVMLVGNSGAQYTATGIFQINGTAIWEFLSTIKSGTISVQLAGVQPSSGQFSAPIAISNVAAVNAAAIIGHIALNDAVGNGDVPQTGDENTIAGATGGG